MELDDHDVAIHCTPSSNSKRQPGTRPDQRQLGNAMSNHATPRANAVLHAALLLLPEVSGAEKWREVVASAERGKKHQIFSTL